MVKIGIITGSTRPDRMSIKVAQWVFEFTENSIGATFEIIDLKKQALPFIGEGDDQPFKNWRKLIHSFDGFIFITPEYNHGLPAVLKNALDAAYTEWKHKPVALISYGFVGGARAAEQMRLLCGALGLVDIQEHSLLFLGKDIDEKGTVTISERRRQKTTKQLHQLIDYAGALKPLRTKKDS